MRKSPLEKLKVQPQWRILPCQAPDCDIFTNKRYRGPNGSKPVVACMISHAETVGNSAEK